MEKSPEQSYILDKWFGGNKDNKPDQPAETEQRLKEKEVKANLLADEIQALRKQATSVEDFELLLQKSQQLERIFEGGESIEMQEAREILGDNFFGVEQIQEAFGIEIDNANIPELTYSREDLEKAKELGEMLVLRLDKDKHGKPFTMMRVLELAHPKFEAKGYGKVLRSGVTDGSGKVMINNDSWYKNEDFVYKDKLKARWKLVSKDFISPASISTSKNYIEQTRRLRDYLQENNFLTEEELAECSNEQLDKIDKFMNADYDKNWPEVARQLAELLINKNHRRSAVEALYDWALVMGSKGERLLETKYEWTNTRSSDGNLVDFGDADTKGASVSRDGPRNSYGDLGVVSVR